MFIVFIFYEELKILKLYGSTNISVSQRSNLSLSLEDESPEQFLFENLNIVRNTQLPELSELPERKFPVSSRLKTNKLSYRQLGEFHRGNYLIQSHYRVVLCGALCFVMKAVM